MTETKTCPQCGAPLPADAPEQPCPACLMKLGLASSVAGNPSRGELPPTSPSPEQSPAPFEPPAVEQLQGVIPNLEILELVGSGGMGAVYKARQPHLDRLVALKILPPHLAQDPAFEERFTREARVLAKLIHPHIVAVYDFGQTRYPKPPSAEKAVSSGAGISEAAPREGEGGERTEPGEGDGKLYYFIMEYVDGANVRQLIQQGGLKPEEALAIVPQICEALQYAHDQGVVHRDIKPENILIDRQGRVKIADFGLAKLVRPSPQPPAGGERAAEAGPRELTLTGTGQVMGTVHYMAPEQMRGSHAVDHRADIYSLGVVFYEMLTGELPIGRFEPPSKKVQIDVRLDEVVLRALESEPQRRYQKASEMKTDVETIGGSVNLVATKQTKPSIPFFNRPYVRLGLLFAAAMLLARHIWVKGILPYSSSKNAVAGLVRPIPVTGPERRTPGLSIYRYHLHVPRGYYADFSTELWRDGKLQPSGIKLDGIRAVSGPVELRLLDGETMSPLSANKLRWEWSYKTDTVAGSMYGWIDDPFTGMEDRDSWTYRGASSHWVLEPGKLYTVLILRGWKEAGPHPIPAEYMENPTDLAEAIQNGKVPRADVELHLKVAIRSESK